VGAPTDTDVGPRPAAQAADASGLVDVVQRLSLAPNLAGIQEIVRHAARELSGADGATFVLRDGDRCHYADEDAIAPLWKGQRFPMTSCISGWAMLNREAAVIPDIYVDDRIPHEAYRPTFVKSLAMVPIRTLDPIGAIGVYWQDPHQPTEEELSLIRALADSTAVAMEIVERRRAEEEVRQLSLTDDLTGVSNRRGLYLLAKQRLAAAWDAGMSVVIAFVDIDGMKTVNDSFGHEEGSRLLVELASLLRDEFRSDDVIARIGGDEFAVLVAGPGLNGDSIRERVQRRIRAANENGTGRLAASVGVAVPNGPYETLDDLLARADADMYVHKGARAR
jgi:diguanylate cyclase (GGDEF)-like protein